MFFGVFANITFLRHEEFKEGCKASCNGPYDGKWSKSMVGYGPEDSHFVIELTYNYGIGSYKLGTDFLGITINSPDVIENIKNHNYPSTEIGGVHIVTSPDGYQFHIVNQVCEGDPIQKVTLACSNMGKSVDYWTNLCGMKKYSFEEKKAVLGYADNQCKLELCDISKAVDHATAFGRIAFSCPREQLPSIQEGLKAAGQTILTPLVSLDTPGKATVEVVIPADPDGHEICFVGDEAFRELSQVDPEADLLLDKAIAADKSEEWFAKKGKTKASA
ncbi:glyoxalase domain-containing protein 4-like isoform X2 [Dreissena polymorpha]|uniref:glyoxalase domain-containing protein 4-like isoform X2 n=1 Tax=Dreissena polymorpha TaxID=45954 RepID=UPI002264F77A|nr:glyoxalase domain-containing protein 4-like isoform X2 [Dreissena polymorpha]